MTRVLRRLLVAATFVAGLTVVGATPAQADFDACAAVGHLDVGPGGRMGYPTLDELTYASFDMQLTTEGCLAVDTPYISGVVFGHCGLAKGYGVTETGHEFLFDWVGTQLVMHLGDAQGTFTLVEQPLYPLCISGAAHTFTAVGAFTKNHLT